MIPVALSFNSFNSCSSSFQLTELSEYLSISLLEAIQTGI